MTQAHKELARKIRFAAQKSLERRVRLFERHAGLLYTWDGTPIKPFHDGQADLYGWLKVGDVARHVEIELKVGRDKLSDEQENWRRVCEDCGVLYSVVHIESRDAIDDGVARVVDALSRGSWTRL